MNSRVDEIPCRISRPRRVTARHAARLNVQTDHVAGRQHAEMAAQWVHPHEAWVLRVAHGYMPGLALGETTAGEEPERRRHMRQDVAPLGTVVWKRGDSCFFSAVSYVRSYGHYRSNYLR